MSMTLNAFLKSYDRANSGGYHHDTELFKAYCEANNMTFRDEVERRRCQRFFCLGYNIKEAIRESNSMVQDVQKEHISQD